MQVIITAVGPDNRGLADPIVHSLTDLGANIAEIQMYDHDAESVFSMLTRVDLPADQFPNVQPTIDRISKETGLSIRAWSPDFEGRKPRIAICCTFRPETPTAILDAINDGHIQAEASVLISNRPKLEHLSKEYDVPWRLIADDEGNPDDEKLIAICDEFEVDYVVLARYMRVLPASSCWKYAGGRIINLHHGLLPSFPGIRPYHDANAARMLTYGATCHFIVPELDAGNQTINQSTYSVRPGASLIEIIQQGQSENEPACLVEGVRRVIDGEVQLHFNKVVAV